MRRAEKRKEGGGGGGKGKGDNTRKKHESDIRARWTNSSDTFNYQDSLTKVFDAAAGDQSRIFTPTFEVLMKMLGTASCETDDVLHTAICGAAPANLATEGLDRRTFSQWYVEWLRSCDDWLYDNRDIDKRISDDAPASDEEVACDSTRDTPTLSQWENMLLRKNPFTTVAGTWVDRDSTRIEGTFAQGVPHGHAVAKFPNGACYKGQWHHGRWHGKGELKCPNRDVYTGMFSEGVQHGVGELRFATGGAYKGQWRRGSPCGHGLYTHRDSASCYTLLDESDRSIGDLIKITDSELWHAKVIAAALSKAATIFCRCNLGLVKSIAEQLERLGATRATLDDAKAALRQRTAATAVSSLEAVRDESLEAHKEAVELLISSTKALPVPLEQLRIELEEVRDRTQKLLASVEQELGKMQFPLKTEGRVEIERARRRFDFLRRAVLACARACERYDQCVEELPRLRRWLQAKPTLGDIDEARKARNRVRRRLRAAKLELEGAREDEADEQEVAKAKAAVQTAKDDLLHTNAQLDAAFRSALEVIDVFPELTARLAKAIGFSVALVHLWRDSRELEDYDTREDLGGSGQRHRVHKVTLAGNVTALKEFPMDPKQRTVFAREVEAMAQLKHPAIMPIISVFVDSARGSLFMEMPHCAGGHITTWVATAVPGLERIRVVLRQALQGVDKMHTAGYVHGDIKPSNCLMTRTDVAGATPCLSDFETSRDAAALSMRTTITGRGGTPAYMAPELQDINGIGVATCASDMYAFGRLVAEVREEMRHIDQQRAGDSLKDLVAKLTADDPQQRPTAAEALQHPFFTATAPAEPERSCCLCYDEGVPRRCGVECAGNGGTQQQGEASVRHFMCTGCFEGYVNEQSDEENRRLLAERRGLLFCPLRGHGCGAPAYTEREISMAVSSATFDAYMRARMAIMEARLAMESEQRVQQQVKAEVQRLQRLGEHERAVHNARLLINETVLNLACPRCKQVFADFNGCCALTCSRAGCGCNFCAYCQADCGDDAHNHVSKCTDGDGGGLFPPDGHLQAVWRVRRQRQLEDVLGRLKASVRDDVIQGCARELRDLGLDVPVVPEECLATARAEEAMEARELLVEMGVNREQVAELLEVSGGDLHFAAQMFFEA